MIEGIFYDPAARLVQEWSGGIRKRSILRAMLHRLSKPTNICLNTSRRGCRPSFVFRVRCYSTIRNISAPAALTYSFDWTLHSIIPVHLIKRGMEDLILSISPPQAENFVNVTAGFLFQLKLDHIVLRTDLSRGRRGPRRKKQISFFYENSVVRSLTATPQPAVTGTAV